MLRNRDSSLGSNSLIMDKRKNQYLEQKYKDATFKPKINSRSNSISDKFDRSTDNLYQDALRRQD
jgi:hypothetical protein